MSQQSSTASRAPAHIRARGVCVDFTVAGRVSRVLHDVSLSVPKGGFVSLIGPSGCGKTTLLKVLAGLLPPSAGEVSVAGVTPIEAVRQRRIGVVFQEATLLPWKNALDNVALLMEVAHAGRTRDEIRQRATDMLRLVGLEHAAEKRPAQLSGGMRQRVSIARALALDPEVLMMDEPFGALDAITREEMSAFLLEIWERTKKTIILVTHSIDEATFLSREVHVMASNPAKIIEAMPINLLYPRNEDSYAAPEFARASARLRRLLKEGHRRAAAMTTGMNDDPVPSVAPAPANIDAGPGLVANARGALARLMPAFALFVAVLVLWEGVSRILKLPEFVLPPPTAILEVLIAHQRDLSLAAYVTATEVLYGFILSAVIGAAVALVIARFARFGRALYPLVVLFQTVPKVALAPLFILWFGFDLAPKVMLIVVIAFFPVAINMLVGLQTVDPNLIALMRSVGASRNEILRRIQIPNSLPYLMAGLKVAVTLAVIGAIVGEFAGAQAGLGYMIQFASTQMQTSLVFAALVEVSILGLLFYYVIEWLEKRYINWVPSAN